jgi:thiol-disulfide isomerase/thioredoxin
VANDHSVADLNEDPEARLEFLEATGVFEVEGEAVSTAGDFEQTRNIYADTYGENGVSDEQLAETVVDLFDVDPETAHERIDSDEDIRHQVVSYLSLQSHLERDLPSGTLALLAEMVAQVGVGSAVPEGMAELTDEDYREFIDEAGDAIVFVWKYPCDPCLKMKQEIPEVLDQLPDRIAVGGVDGEAVRDLLRAFEVEAAPTTLLFSDGELVESHRGYAPPAKLAESVAEVYDDVSVEVVEQP